MTTTVLNCDTGTIAPYVPSVDMPWDKKRVMHLYRRMTFGGLKPEQIEGALVQDPGELVDSLIDAAIALPLPEQPEWAFWTINDYTDLDNQPFQQIQSWILKWLNDMLANGFRDKLSLFWHNHFVTRLDTYGCPSYMYQYHKLLQQFALGNFKDFVKEIGKTPAMLVFLNGLQNSNFEPNENYGRELYELFTLGRDNGYTQTDVEQTARALTGWVGHVVDCGPIGFVPTFHDDGEKTIFGQTGNWGYDDVHDLLFEQRGALVAQHICKKIYRHFVNPVVNQDIVNELAATFQNNNFDLAPVYRQLFKSEHFFNDNIIGSIVKNPLETMFTFILETGLPFNDDMLEVMGYFSTILGQDLFNPVDVAGWQEDHDWVNSNTLTGRWQATDFYLGTLFDNQESVFQQFGLSLVGESIDPYHVTQMIVDHFIPNGLQTQQAYDQATIIFKWEVPQNYYENGIWNMHFDTVPVQVVLLLQHISRLPEFQLA